MKKSTICFCVEENKVLLGMKKQGFGAGKWNGFGGKIKDGEDARAAAARELLEESLLIAKEENLEPCAIINFYFEGDHVFECHVFITKNWRGVPVETDEMRPLWFPVNKLPYSEMWAADSKWIPLVLQGQKIRAEIEFNKEGTELKDFSFTEAELL